MDLARAAELIGRGPGIIATPPTAGEVERLLEQARPLADGDPAAEARILTAEAFNLDERDPEAQAPGRPGPRARPIGRRPARRERGARHADRASRLAARRPPRRLDSALRRTELLAPLPVTADVGAGVLRRLPDGVRSAPSRPATCGRPTASARGCATCRSTARRTTSATSRLIVVGLLSGAWDEALELVRACSAPGWERAGRPDRRQPPPRAVRRGHRPRRCAATTTPARTWMDVVAHPGRPPAGPWRRSTSASSSTPWCCSTGGRPPTPSTLLADAPEEFVNHYNGMWRPWYASAWAEAAVLAGRPDARERVERARCLTVGNPVVEAVVARAAALLGAAARTGRADLARRGHVPARARRAGTSGRAPW